MNRKYWVYHMHFYALSLLLSLFPFALHGGNFHSEELTHPVLGKSTKIRVFTEHGIQPKEKISFSESKKNKINKKLAGIARKSEEKWGSAIDVSRLKNFDLESWLNKDRELNTDEFYLCWEEPQKYSIQWIKNTKFRRPHIYVNASDLYLHYPKERLIKMEEIPKNTEKRIPDRISWNNWHRVAEEYKEDLLFLLEPLASIHPERLNIMPLTNHESGYLLVHETKNSLYKYWLSKTHQGIRVDRANYWRVKNAGGKKKRIYDFKINYEYGKSGDILRVRMKSQMALSVRNYDIHVQSIDENTPVAIPRNFGRVTVYDSRIQPKRQYPVEHHLLDKNTAQSMFDDMDRFKNYLRQLKK